VDALKASVGRIVHYVSLGSADGRYTPMCRAAVVTQIAPGNPDLVGLAVINPAGVFFDVAVQYEPGEEGDEQPAHRCCTPDWVYPGGTWHWPART
jgi:hypothetical protein